MDYFAGDERSSYERMMAGDFYVADDLVTRDLPPGVLAVGNPARVVRELTDDDSDARRGPSGPRGRA